MNVRTIITKYLEDNGFDGLCCDGCGCGLDDLIPCSGDALECKPAKRYACDGTCSGCASTGEHDLVSDCYRTVEVVINEEETHL